MCLACMVFEGCLFRPALDNIIKDATCDKHPSFSVDETEETDCKVFSLSDCWAASLSFLQSLDLHISRTFPTFYSGICYLLIFATLGQLTSQMLGVGGVIPGLQTEILLPALFPFLVFHFQCSTGYRVSIATSWIFWIKTTLPQLWMSSF